VSVLRRLPGLLAARLALAAYLAGWSLVRRLPEAWVVRLFGWGADLAAAGNGTGVRRLRTNYARVTGRPPEELDALVRAGLRSYARYWLQVFRLQDRDTRYVEEHTRAEGFEILADGVAAGRGLVVALGHSGNWDHAGAWLVGRGVPFTTVAERLEPAALFDRFVAFRESLGMEVVALTGGRPPFDVLADRLRAGGALCLLADRDLSAAGVPVRFFGATATMPAGPAALALRTGATLAAAILWYDDADPSVLHIRIEGPVPHTDVPAMTQQLADVFARGVAEHPQDWHMLARLWRDDLERRPVGAS